MEIFKTEKFIDMSHTIASPLFDNAENPWGVLPLISEFIKGLGPYLGSEYVQTADFVWQHHTAHISPTARIEGPAIIGAGASMEHCSYIRGGVVVGADCVIGCGVEVQNSIICDEAQLLHYCYVADSIIGYKACMGAGSVTSNFKNDRTNICVSFSLGKIDTKLKQFGAVVGDNSQIGSNTNINPGTIICRNVSIYSMSNVRGMINENVIYKEGGRLVQRVKIKKELPKGAFEMRA